MNTVKEFNNAGLIAVKGDYIGHPTKANCTETMVYVAEPEYIMAANEYKDYSFKSFAWRTNTGVEPEFNGRVDAKFSNGQVITPYDKGLLGWSLAGNALPIIEWRPRLARSKQTVFDVDAHVSDASKHHCVDFSTVSSPSNSNDSPVRYDNPKKYMNLSKSKVDNDKELKDRYDLITPYNLCIAQIASYLGVTTGGVDVARNGSDICATAEDIIEGIKKAVKVVSDASKVGNPALFTKAMEMNGELPPVGSECIACSSIGHKEKVTVAHRSGSQFACTERDGNYLIQYTNEGGYFEAIDTRTDKEKAVDDGLLLIGFARGGNTERHLNTIYDLWVKK
jgi:hypothetical protein